MGAVQSGAGLACLLLMVFLSNLPIWRSSLHHLDIGPGVVDELFITAPKWEDCVADLFSLYVCFALKLVPGISKQAQLYKGALCMKYLVGRGEMKNFNI